MSDYFMAFAGGVLHNLATSINLFYKGRMTDVSRALWGTITQDQDTLNWKLPFLLAFIFVGSLARLFTAFDAKSKLFESAEDSVAGLSAVGFLLGGLLVGAGAKMMNGCSSHLSSGVSSLSSRSGVAAFVFLLAGVLAANLREHLGLFETYFTPDVYILSIFDSSYAHLFVLYSSFAALAAFLWNKLNKRNYKAVENILIGSYVGMIYALSLLVSGVVKRSKVIDFLTFSKNWDASLLIFMATAISLTLVTFQVILRLDTPFRSTVWEFNADEAIDAKLVTGATLFGLGWGLTGLCPGPALLLFQFGTVKISLVYLTGMLCGMAAVHFSEGLPFHILTDAVQANKVVSAGLNQLRLLSEQKFVSSLTNIDLKSLGLRTPVAAKKKASFEEPAELSGQKTEKKRAEETERPVANVSGQDVNHRTVS